MLRLRVAALVGAALLLLGTGCSSGEETVTGDGYGFDVPSGWDGKTDDGRTAGQAGLDALVYGPETEGFATNVNVVRQPGISPRLSVTEYVDLGFEQVRTEPQTFGLPEDVELKVIDRAADGPELDGQPSRQVTYSLDDGEMLLQLRQLAAIRDGVAYTITYSALEPSFGPDLDGFDEILASWRWSGAPPDSE